MQPIYLVCGVPGSGKTWVCSQLSSKYNWVPHDENMSRITFTLWNEAQKDKPVITEVPFAERKLRDDLQKLDLKVRPYFIVEPVEVVRQRYMQREGMPLSKAFATRCSSIIMRAIEWKAPYGTSSQILTMLSL